MPRKYKRPLGARNYLNYSKETLQQCLASIRNGELSQRKAEKLYKIPRRTIIYKLKNLHPLKPGLPPIFTQEEEIAFVGYIQNMSDFGFPLDSFDLRCIVKSYLNRIGRQVNKFKDNVPGHEWVLGFLKRHPDLTIRFASNIKRSRAAINEQTLREYLSNLGEVVKDVLPENIWNFDESNLTDNPGQKKVIVKRGVKYPEKIRNSSKTSISLMFAGNAAGEILPPYVVYRSTHLWSTWTENGPTGCRYSNTKSGWFDALTFTDWWESLMLPRLKKLTGNKVVICDNLSSHITLHVLKLCKQFDIFFVCLPANSTHLTQPLDVAFFHPMKVAWRKILSEWRESADGFNNSVLQKQHFPLLLKRLMNILAPNIGANLKSGFRKCGIYPLNVEELLSRIPKARYDKDAMETSFLESLEIKRAEWTNTKAVGGRKKLAIAPGKSITHAVPVDITDETEAGTSMASAVQGKKQSKAIKLINGKKDRISSDSSDDSNEDEMSLRESSEDFDFDHEVLKMAEEKEIESDLVALTTGNKKPQDLYSFQSVVRKVDQHVVFMYEGEIFPGKIIDYNKKGANISAMQRSCKSWKWPEIKDELFYPWEDVIGNINPPKLVSRRGFFAIPELDKIWWI